MLLQESIKKLLRYFYRNAYRRRQSRNCSVSKQIVLHSCSDQEASTENWRISETTYFMQLYKYCKSAENLLR